MVGGKAAVAAGAVTRRRVRCSAWLGVGVSIIWFFVVSGIHSNLSMKPDTEGKVHPTVSFAVLVIPRRELRIEFCRSFVDLMTEFPQSASNGSECRFDRPMQFPGDFTLEFFVKIVCTSGGSSQLFELTRSESIV